MIDSHFIEGGMFVREELKIINSCFSLYQSKPKSYAQADGAIKNMSLLHTDIRPTDKETGNVTRTYQTRIYRGARSIHAYLLDITPCKIIYTSTNVSSPRTCDLKLINNLIYKIYIYIYIYKLS